MILARFSRTFGLIVAVSLLAACTSKRDDQTTQPVATGESLEGHAPSWSSAGGCDGARPSDRQAATLLPITPEDAIKCVGQTRTVCGTVVSARYAVRTKGRPTYLNLDRAYPDQIFTMLIWGSDRAKFPAPPETHYRGKKICVTGRIVEYRGRAEIIVNAPAQIAISE